MRAVLNMFIALVVVTMMAGCTFTGVESTQKVSDKEVARTLTELERRQPTMTLTPFSDSVPAWQTGKRFYVTDDQARLIFSNINIDSLKLAGNILTYDGYESGSVLDNRETLNLKFLTADGKTLIYRTGKTRNEFQPSFSIPLLIDMDIVADADRQLRGRDVFVTTPIWYDPESSDMKHGRQFIKVHIDSVVPGNKVLPLKVHFTAWDNDEKAFVWMSAPGAIMHNRDFDSLFSLRNLHDNYPDISQTVWDNIVNGKVTVGMTKEECRLSLGAPQRINRVPNQAALREYWFYDGGCYLFFVDGILNQFRR